jgi:hypothetical protein
MPKDTGRGRHSRRSFKCLLPLLFFFFVMLIFTLVFLPLPTDAMENPNEAGDATTTTVAQQRRNKQAKMWYLRRIQVGNTTLPFSAVTLAIVFLSIYYLLSNWNGSGGRGSNVYCEASHILISDHSEAGQKTLLEYQKKIQSDAALFAKHAQKFSSCASKNNGGNLVSCCFALHPISRRTCSGKLLLYLLVPLHAPLKRLLALGILHLCCPKKTRFFIHLDRANFAPERCIHRLTNSVLLPTRP